MSKIFENNIGCYLSHEKYINKVYNGLTSSNGERYRLNSNLFKIYTPYKKVRNKLKVKRNEEIMNKVYKELKKEQDDVKLKLNTFLSNICFKELLSNEMMHDDNTLALKIAEYIQSNCQKHRISDCNGFNYDQPVIKEIQNAKFLFPENSEFFCKDVIVMNKTLEGRKFDLILLDPPWWNKYIRRKRKKSSDAYNMMFNEDLKQMPIDDLLSHDGLVVVWCTNSEQNINALLNEFFPQWNVEYTSKWYWIKITKNGVPVCSFSPPPGKQPYEKIIFAYRKRSLPLPEDGKLLISVPSALHSHKPPLVDVLKDYLPKNPRCLEVFARYLLPNWTSYGNEVLKLQHESLFVLEKS